MAYEKPENLRNIQNARIKEKRALSLALSICDPLKLGGNYGKRRYSS